MDDGLTEPSSQPDTGPVLRELFSRTAPYYLSLGMPLEEFWHGEPASVIQYRAAEEHRKRRRERELWSQGRYFLYAVASIFCEGVSYPDQPWPVTRQEAEERQKQEEQTRLEAEQLKMRQWVEDFRTRKEGENHGNGN